MTYKEWHELRGLLTTLNDVVEERISSITIAESFDNVWDMVDDIKTKEIDDELQPTKL